MALSPHEHLRLCDACLGAAYGGVLPVRLRLKASVYGGAAPEHFEVEPGTGGRCVRCKGSGFDNATAREAFEREHRQNAEPLPRQEDDPRVLTLLP